MARVKVLSANFSKTLSDQVKSRVLVDFGSPPSARSTLTRSFDPLLEKAVDRLLSTTVPDTVKLFKDDYKDSLDAVGEVLRQGIDQSQKVAVAGAKFRVKFRPLTVPYYRRKSRVRPGTQNLFWKFTGDMAVAYRKFAGYRKSSTSQAKSIIQLKNRSYIYRGRRYRYQIEYTLPPIPRSQMLDNIFRLSYVLASTKQRGTVLNRGYVENLQHSDPMSVLAFNESLDHKRSRPFITQLMAMRGQRVRDMIVDRLQKKWAKGRRG